MNVLQLNNLKEFVHYSYITLTETCFPVLNILAKYVQKPGEDRLRNVFS